MTIKIEQQLHWSINNNGKKFSTYNKNEKIYDVWLPYRSKLAAAIINGLEIFPFFENTSCIYVDSSPENTLNHILNIIGTKEKVFTLNNQQSNYLNNLKNNFPNLMFFDNISTIKTVQVDVLYVSLSEQNYADIILNLQDNLKTDGFLIFIINNSDLTNEKNLLDLIKTKFDIIQEVFLDDYFKSQTLILCKPII